MLRSIPSACVLPSANGTIPQQAGKNVRNGSVAMRGRRGIAPNIIGYEGSLSKAMALDAPAVEKQNINSWPSIMSTAAAIKNGRLPEGASFSLTKSSNLGFRLNIRSFATTAIRPRATMANAHIRRGNEIPSRLLDGRGGESDSAGCYANDRVCGWGRIVHPARKPIPEVLRAIPQVHQMEASQAQAVG